MPHPLAAGFFLLEVLWGAAGVGVGPMGDRFQEESFSGYTPALQRQPRWDGCAPEGKTEKGALEKQSPTGGR